MLNCWTFASQTLEFCLRTTEDNYVRRDIVHDFLWDDMHHCGFNCDCEPSMLLTKERLAFSYCAEMGKDN